MFNEFIEYMSKFISKEEISFAILGLIFLIIIWIDGCKYEKEQEKKRKRKGKNNKCI